MDSDNLSISIIAGLISIALLINSQLTHGFTSIWSYISGAAAGVICMCLWDDAWKDDDNG